MSSYFIDGRSNIKTTLTEHITLKGNLSFEESLELNGSFYGNIYSKGLLVIGKTAKIKGNIYSRDLIIEGQVSGEILVYNRVSIEDNAEVLGNITTHKIKVTSNVTIEGDCFTMPEEKVLALFKKAAPESYFRNTNTDRSKLFKQEQKYENILTRDEVKKNYKKEKK